jgi:hypothetical protein
MPKSYRNTGSTFRKPKRPFEKERLTNEMKIVGQYGKNFTSLYEAAREGEFI